MNGFSQGIAMRVALFTENFLPKVDGIVTVLCLLLDHLATRGIQTVIVTSDRGIEHYHATRVIGVPASTVDSALRVRYKFNSWQPDRFASSLTSFDSSPKRSGIPISATIEIALETQ